MYRTTRLLSCCLVAVSWVATLPVVSAQSPASPPPSPVVATSPSTPDEGRSPIRQDEDEPDLGAITIGKWLSLGGSVQSDFHGLSSGGLATGEIDSEFESGLQLRVLFTPSPHVRVFAKAESARSVVVGGFPGSTSEGWEPSLQEAYVEVSPPGSLPIVVQVGRQRFRDGQEWLFDEYRTPSG